MRDDGLYYFRPTWIAGSILCYGKRKSHFPYHCMVGPDWFMVIIVYVLMFLVNGVVLFIVSPLGYVPVIIGTVGALWLLYIFSATAFTDSGIVYSNDYTKNPVSTQTTIAGKSQSSSNATPATILADRHSSSETEALVEVKDPLHVHDHHCDHKRPSDIELVEQEHAEGLAEDTTSSPVVASAFPQQLPLVSNHHNMPAVPTYEETVHTMECGQCQIQRPYSARHCHYCEVCVDHLDHHCPW